MRRGAFNSGAVSTLLRESGPTPANPAYWETRLVRGTFTAEARPRSEKELFVRFEREGQWIYFPLESSVPGKAAVRACEIYRLLTDSGWDAVCRRYVRQIIWAIFWFSEPLGCTYATLFTAPEPKAVSPRLSTVQNGSRLPVALIDPSPEIRRGLEQGLKHSPGYLCVQSVALAKELLDRPTTPSNTPRLVLFNQRSLDLAADAFQEELQARWPGTLAVPFGVYGHSDELFTTIHGMDKGYFLRRRTPRQILEPLEGFWQTKSNLARSPSNPLSDSSPGEGEVWRGRGPRNLSTAARLRTHVQAYFQKLILSGSPNENSGESGTLTQRETEILRYLGAGQTDKTISAILGISAWTVHAHVKSIFEKLGVHTRAEAIMRYLQK
jgi:DNA-binding NarL/FixJ family response regulator